MVGLEAGKRRGEWEDDKGYEETLRSDDYVHCFDCDDDFIGVDIQENILSCTLEICTYF